MYLRPAPHSPLAHTRGERERERRHTNVDDVGVMEEPDSRASRERKEVELLREVEIGGDVLGRVLPMYDNLDDFDFDFDFDPAEFHIEEGMVAEVMKRLEEEINQPCAGESGGSPPHAHVQPYQVVPSLPSSSFVTINGNEESCGPSFSDSASTVMASIDTCGGAGPQRQPVPASGVGKAGKAGVVWPWFLEPTAEAALGPPSGAGAAGGGDATADFGAEDMDDVWDEGWLACVLASARLGVEGEEERVEGLD